MDEPRWCNWQLWRVAWAVPEIRSLRIPVIDALGEWRRVLGSVYLRVG